MAAEITRLEERLLELAERAESGDPAEATKAENEIEQLNGFMDHVASLHDDDPELSIPELVTILAAEYRVFVSTDFVTDVLVIEARSKEEVHNDHK